MPDIVGTKPVYRYGQPGYGVGTKWFIQKSAGEDTTSDEPDQDLINQVDSAIEVGYRHFDAAEVYGTERELGIALKESKIPRSEFWVTTKILGSVGDVEKGLRTSLEKMQLEYVDLYLIHAPFFPAPPLEEVWKGMEGVLEKRLTKNIGVSNFRIQEIEKVLAIAKHKPIINQGEFHAYCQTPNLARYLADNDILFATYGPLTPLVAKKDGPVTPVVEELAKKYGKTPAQILLQWTYQQHPYFITSSSNPQRQKEQLYFNQPPWKLLKGDLNAISEAGKSAPMLRRYWAEISGGKWDDY